MKRRLLMVVMVLLMVLVISACSNKDQEAAKNNVSAHEEANKQESTETSDNTESNHPGAESGEDAASEDTENNKDEIGSNTELVDEPAGTEEEPTVAGVNHIEIDYSVVKPNESAQILIVMYHSLCEGEPRDQYQRNIDDFKNDLQTMYDMGFSLLSMHDLITGNITTPLGRAPIVLTFDDAYSSEFSLMTENGELVPKTDCAVDIIDKFSADHPEFGKAAAFYIYGKDPFSGAGTLTERFAYLIDNGYEIGSHTYTHPDLSKCTPETIQEEFGKTEKLIRDNAPDYIVESFAFPYGIRPIEEHRDLAFHGEYDGVIYDYQAGLRVGQVGTSANPFHVKFDTRNLPRVQGSDCVDTDLGWFFRTYEENPSSMFISDGMPDVVTVPKSKEGLINIDALGDRQFVVYE